MERSKSVISKSISTQLSKLNIVNNSGHLAAGSTDDERSMTSVSCHNLRSEDVSNGSGVSPLEYSIFSTRRHVFEEDERIVQQRLNEHDEMSEVIPGLYLSSLSALYNKSTLHNYNIKTVLSVMSQRPLIQKFSGLSYHFFSIDDTDESDLLTHFTQTNVIISRSLDRNENILVHCFVGSSRSATIVVAYLMHNFKIGFSDAIEFVCKRRSVIAPNKGFLIQLGLYEKIDFNVDFTNIWLRRYIFKCIVNIMSVEMKTGTSVNRLIETFKLYNKSSSLIKQLVDSQKELNSNVVYKCGTCRFVLFTNEHVFNKDHLSYHVSILEWMVDNDNYYIPCGRIYCPVCDRKLGRFKWIMPYICYAYYEFHGKISHVPWTKELKVPMVFSISTCNVDRSVEY